MGVSALGAVKRAKYQELSTKVSMVSVSLLALLPQFGHRTLSQSCSRSSGFPGSLNEIFLGKRSYGIAAAALNYFNKSLDELYLHEIAYLAGLPKGPNNYDPVKNKRFVVGVDRSKMRLFDIEESEQDNLVDDTPVFDSSKMSERFKEFNV